VSTQFQTEKKERRLSEL